MKRMLFSLAILTLVIQASAAAQTLSVGSGSAKCGQSVQVPVRIDAVSGLLALEFTGEYDATRLTVTNVVASGIAAGFSVAFNSQPGAVKVAMASASAASGTGPVATVSFTVAPAAEGAVSVSITGALVNDEPVDTVTGQILIDCTKPPEEAPIYVSPVDGESNVDPPVELRWNPVAGAKGYQVYFGTSTPPPAADASTGTSLPVSTATGTTHFWRVAAYNEAGESPVGPIWSFTTSGPFCVTPASPIVSAPDSVISGTPFDVVWQAVDGATEYLVQESAEQQFSNPSSTSTSMTGASFTRSSEVEITHYYRVRARNSGGGCNVDGGFSNAVGVRVRPRPLIPAGSAILPVVGSAPGAFGSYFRTAVQLHNPGSTALDGVITYHVQGASGGEEDPTVEYSIAPQATVAFEDLLPGMNVESGIGSADLTPANGQQLPIVVTRIFNDAGSDGTSGMNLDLVTLDDTLIAPAKGVLVAPLDSSRFRMNVGFRTLAKGVELTATLRDKAGAIVATKSLTYPATFFVQLPAAELLGAEIPPSGSLSFVIESGSVIVYGSTTDNTTQDTSVQLARPIP